MPDRMRSARIGGSGALSGVPPSSLPPSEVASRGDSLVPTVSVRIDPRASDLVAVRQLLEVTGYFRADEVDIGVELVQETLSEGTAATGYHWLFVDDESEGARIEGDGIEGSSSDGGSTENQADGSRPASFDPARSRDPKLLGYACFGPIPLTLASWDLYWIAVDPAQQGRGLGRQLLRRAEQSSLAMGARTLWVETSGREEYLPTRGFYRSRGYSVAAHLRDFYAKGDDKVIFEKVLEKHAHEDD